MKTLSNLAGSYLTSDAVADAVVGYHESLERLGAVDLIDVPVLDHGLARLAPMAVGSLTQIDAREAAQAGSTAEAHRELQRLAQEWVPPPT